MRISHALMVCLFVLVSTAYSQETTAQPADPYEDALVEASKQWGLNYSELDSDNRVIWQKLLKIAREQGEISSPENVVQAFVKAGEVGARYTAEREGSDHRNNTEE